jgi:undecaprenyl-diphosphatase
MASSSSTVRRALWAASTVALLVFGVVVEQVMTTGALVRYDRRTAQNISHGKFFQIMIGRAPHVGRWIEPSRAVTVFGDARFIAALAIGAGLLLLTIKRPRAALFVVGATFSGVLLDLVVRSYIGGVRPAMPSPFSFASQDGMPSGHALDATVCFGAIVLVCLPHLPIAARILVAAAAGALVAAVAVSRVILLTHYASDVIGGVALGLAWVFALAALFEPWDERSESMSGAIT